LEVLGANALRDLRANARWGNRMKDLTTEQYRLISEQPIYPKNLYADRAPYKHDEYRREVLEPQVRLLQERGVYAPPDGAAGAEPEQPPAIDLAAAPLQTAPAAPNGG
jgi:hypothetical protein